MSDPTDSCAEVCAGLQPYATALSCPTTPTCEQDCIDGLAQFNCNAEYFAAIECAFQTPVSSWDCFPPDGPGYLGNECDAEIAILEQCLGI